jgi:hypothetical protein
VSRLRAVPGKGGGRQQARDHVLVAHGHRVYIYTKLSKGGQVLGLGRIFKKKKVKRIIKKIKQNQKNVTELEAQGSDFFESFSAQV